MDPSFVAGYVRILCVVYIPEEKVTGNYCFCLMQEGILVCIYLYIRIIR